MYYITFILSLLRACISIVYTTVALKKNDLCSVHWLDKRIYMAGWCTCLSSFCSSWSGITVWSSYLKWRFVWRTSREYTVTSAWGNYFLMQTLQCTPLKFSTQISIWDKNSKQWYYYYSVCMVCSNNNNYYYNNYNRASDISRSRGAVKFG